MGGSGSARHNYKTVERNKITRYIYLRTEDNREVTVTPSSHNIIQSRRPCKPYKYIATVKIKNGVVVEKYREGKFV